MNHQRPTWRYPGPRYRMSGNEMSPVRPPLLPTSRWQSPLHPSPLLPQARPRPLMQSPPRPQYYRPRSPHLQQRPQPLMGPAGPPRVLREPWQAGGPYVPDVRQLRPRMFAGTAPQRFQAPNSSHIVDSNPQYRPPLLTRIPAPRDRRPLVSHPPTDQVPVRPLLRPDRFLQPDHLGQGHGQVYVEMHGGGGMRQRDPSSYQPIMTQRLPPRPPPPPPPKIETVAVEELFDDPGRSSRPSQFVIILRGPPGTGKSHVAKLLKDKEVQHSGVAVRILSLDDYFLTEVDSTSVDPETGRKSKKKAIEYCYDDEMEQVYKDSLLKAFSKTLDDPDFPIVIIDAVNHKVAEFEQFWSRAKVKGFEVFVAELISGVEDCVAQSLHGRSREDIAKIVREWEAAPSHYKRLDVRSLHQEVAINEVEMEIGEDAYAQLPKSGSNSIEDSVKPSSRWEAVSDDRLDGLDGVRKSMKRKRESESSASESIEEMLQCLRDTDKRSDPNMPNKKRVRWSDIEEQKQQQWHRKIGFVIGQDWSNLTPDSKAVDQLLTGSDQ